MMNPRNPGLVSIVLCFVVTGCGPAALKTVPVSGKVTLKDRPLPGGAVSFAPDAARNNTAGVNPTGAIDLDGTYQVSTDGKTGAPVGWYKVTVRTQTPGNPTAKPIPIDPRFSDPKKTPLSIEVVENPEPGAYDLKVTK
jgi:hypothetical protein